MKTIVAVREFECPLAPRIASEAARHLLSDLLTQEGLSVPPALPIARDANGRPFLPASPKLPALDFNLSHAGRYVAVALCIAERTEELPRVGIDLECARPRLRPERLARRFFHLAEIRHLENCAFSEAEFLALWTKKEAFLKLTGAGLAGNLQAINTLDPIRLSPAVSFTAYKIEGDPSAHLTLCLPICATPPTTLRFSKSR